MSWSDSDYYGDSYARDESEYHARMQAIEDARKEAKAAELAAEALECAEADEEQEREALTAWKAAHPIEEVLNGWRMAVTTPRYAAIGNGLFVRTGDGKRKRRAA